MFFFQLNCAVTMLTLCLFPIRLCMIDIKQCFDNNCRRKHDVELTVLGVKHIVRTCGIAYMLIQGLSEYMILQSTHIMSVEGIYCSALSCIPK